MSACVCINPGPVFRHDGHCCCSGDVPHAEGWPPAPSCHPIEWRDAYADNFPNQPELPKELLELVEKP